VPITLSIGKARAKGTKKGRALMPKRNVALEQHFRANSAGIDAL